MIKATDFISDDAKKEAEQQALGMLLDAFAKEIGGKVFQKLENGYSGWDNPEMLDNLKKKLLENYQRGDMVDVAALAMMLWNLQQK